jgi:cytochrome b561
VKYFGFTLPQWGWDAPLLKEFFSAGHYLTVWTLIVALALHVAAALKHVFIDRDTIVRRIWSSTRGDKS